MLIDGGGALRVLRAGYGASRDEGGTVMERTVRRAIAALVVMLALGGAAHGALTGAEYALTANGHAPAVAASAGGRVVFVWLAPGGDGNEAVWARRFVYEQPVAAAFVVSAAAGASLSSPVVTMNARGDFVVAWQSTVDGSPAVFARRFRANGRPLGESFALSPDGEAAMHPRIALGPDGRFAAAWDRDVADPQQTVRLAAFTGNGGRIGGPLTLPAVGTDANSLGALAVTRTSVSIAWTERTPCPAAMDPVSAVESFDWALHRMGRVERFANDNPCVDGPHVVGLAAADTSVLGVFEGRRDSMQRFSATNGARLGRRTDFAAYPACDDSDCERAELVAGDSRGRFVLVTELVREVPDGGRYDLFATLFGKDGRARSSHRAIDAHSAVEPEHPAAAFLADGTLVTIWERGQGPAPGGLVFRFLQLP
jgi:hypothetical protein